MKRLLRVLTCVLLALPAAGTGSAAPTDGPAGAADGTAARLLERSAPQYPRLARLRRVEGWVLVSYTVTETGATDDITVIASSIEGFFEEAARRAVGAYRYEPATFLDEPVSQGGLTERIFFILSDQPWEVDDAFRERYERATTALRDGRLSEARDAIDAIAAEPRDVLAEAFYLELLELRHARDRDDGRALLEHLDRALIVAREKAPKPVYQGLLRDAIGLRARESEYASALLDWEALRQTGGVAAEDPLRETVATVREEIDGRDVIERERTLQTCEACRPAITVWDGLLNRKQFSIVPLEGEVDDLEVTCGRHSVSFAWKPDTTWRLNPAWGGCALRAYGSDGTRFRLVEPPG